MFEATYDGESRVWTCDNCGVKTPRITRSRPTNRRKAIDGYLALRAEWKTTDDALTALVNSGQAASGAHLVHSSTFDWHLQRLVDLDKPTNFEVRYHLAQAKANLIKAQAFVAEKKLTSGVAF